MRRIVRIGDIAIGTCLYDRIPWIGIVISGSKRTEANNKKIGRVGEDIVMGGYQPAIIITGSKTVITENRKTARTFDLCAAHPIGLHITGSENVRLT